MAIMIAETRERRCCQPQDLKTYQGARIIDAMQRVKFCVHCGQLWAWRRAPGEIDGGLEQLKIVRTEFL